MATRRRPPFEGPTQTIGTWARRLPRGYQEPLDGRRRFYNANSAVPFENPNGFSNFIEMLSLLLIPVAQVFMFGRMVLALHDAWAVLAAMAALFIVGLGGRRRRRATRSPVLRASGVSIASGHGQSGGNMADKEVRFGIANTALFATATTASSDGAVNGGMDAFTSAGGAVPIANMFVGEVIFGGAGSGLYSMLCTIVLAVFIAGLLVGRTPEYLGKRIEARESSSRRSGRCSQPVLALTLTAISIAGHAGLKSVFNTGAPDSPRRSMPGPRWSTRTAARSPAMAARTSAPSSERSP